MTRALLTTLVRATAVASIGLVALAWPTAHAAVDVTAGALHCTVTSRQPILTLTKRLSGSVTVTCNAATSVGVEMKVVEMDGSVEDRIVEVPLQVRWITVTANTAVVITSTRVTCVSTEVGGEEFATRSRLNVSGKTSGWDRSVPVTDAYAC